MKRNLLYVDDQPENLVVFRAAFGKMFNILEASSAYQALEMFNQHEIPVIVADQRMPEMAGVELCEVVRREHPHTIRMILTGYIETDAMMEAINKGHVYNFITKPWEKKTLYSTLLRGFESYDLSVSNNALLERLGHTERCTTLGRCAAGIAHEMRNQLFILPLIELLEIKYKDDDELMQLANIARDTHERLNGLINEVMDFVRDDGDELVLTPMNLATVAREAVSLARMDKSIPRFALKLTDVVDVVIPCHKAKLQQVLFNLIRNAADAVRGRDKPAIDVAITEDDACVTLSVRDNGPGIDAGHLDRIWEPFYTTKGSEGNGLGLDLCRRVISAHDGTITCESSPETGTLFHIRLSKPRAA